MSVDLERIRELLPNYELGGVIGRGGWGLVLEGRHTQLQREVAIKQLPAAFAADPEVRARFVAEARLLASLDHPHIVPAHDYVESEGMCLLVMEKLSGGSVWDRFTDGGLTPETSCAAGIAATSAIYYANERGILHRDVKPQNLMITGGGVMKVGDFGIAKVLDVARTMATRAGAVLGTPAYMAPEQALGEELGPATDVYALGVTLYQFLAGRLPFETESASAAAVLYQRIHAEPTHLREAAPNLAPPLVDAVMRALETKPADRYEDAERFGVALAEAAGQAFGGGWLSRSEIKLMVGGPLTTAAERQAGPPTPAGARVVPVRPRSKPSPDPEPAPTAKPPAAAEPVPVPKPDPTRVPTPTPTPTPAPTPAPTPGGAPSEEQAEPGRRSKSTAVSDTAHAAAESDLLKRHREGRIPFREEEAANVDLLLAAPRASPAARLGFPEDTTDDELRTAIVAAIDHWRRREENPLTPLPVREAAAILIRTYEGMLQRLRRTGR